MAIWVNKTLYIYLNTKILGLSGTVLVADQILLLTDNDDLFHKSDAIYTMSKYLILCKTEKLFFHRETIAGSAQCRSVCMCVRSAFRSPVY